VAYACHRGRLPATRAAFLLAGLLGADLLRGGAGLNPTVSPAFFAPSPEVLRVEAAVRAAGGRLFTFDPGYSPAYYEARRTRQGAHEVWSFAVLEEALVPHFNLPRGVPTALGLDQTMLAPASRVLGPEEAEPAAFPRIALRLREAAVSHVLAAEPLSDPGLALVEVLSPPRIAPLRLYFYRLVATRPRMELDGPGQLQVREDAPGRLGLEVSLPQRGTLLVRDAWAEGWRLRVDGEPRAVEHGPFDHRLVALEPGRHVLEFLYTPPGLARGVAVTVACGLVILALVLRGGRGSSPPSPTASLV
jgi:hypothetical protein